MAKLILIWLHCTGESGLVGGKANLYMVAKLNLVQVGGKANLDMVAKLNLV